MKLVEFEFEVGRWGHIIKGLCEWSGEDAVVDVIARDYKELWVHIPEVTSFPHIVEVTVNKYKWHVERPEHRGYDQMEDFIRGPANHSTVPEPKH